MPRSQVVMEIFMINFWTIAIWGGVHGGREQREILVILNASSITATVPLPFVRCYSFVLKIGVTDY